MNWIAYSPQAKASVSRRVRSQNCLGVEALEGRALLTASALDPTFGTGGLVKGAADTGSGSAISLQTAVAVQSNGKIVTAGTYQSYSSTPQLAVRRYNTDGSLDTTFGTNGQENIPLPNGGTAISSPPRSLVINGNGSIILAAAVTTPSSNGGSSVQNGLVVQLTSAGQLDSSFGTNGEFTLTTAGETVSTVALQGDGKIVASGIKTTTTGSTTTYQALAIRLTTAGALDSTFDSSGELAITIPGTSTNGVSLSPASIAVAPNGLIYVAVNENTPTNSFGMLTGVLARISLSGTLDTSFGSSGVQVLSTSASNIINAVTVQTDNKLVVAGANYLNTSPVTPVLLRFNTDGSADTSFKGLPVLTNSVTPGGLFNSVTLDSSGKIVVGGTTTQNLGLVERFTTAGAVDPTFGASGRITFSLAPPAGSTGFSDQLSSVAITPSSKIVAAGTIVYRNSSNATTYQSVLAQILPIFTPNQAVADYDGDGKTDIAAELTANAVFAYRASNGSGDVLQQFGQSGLGNSIPVSGDFDGDGIDDPAIYLTNLGEFAYRSSATGKDVLVQFGSAGAGNSIPATGDYDGDGITDLGVYLVKQGVYAYRSSATGKDILQAFGTAGTNGSIPAPGDYDGDGKTDIAVYLPASGRLAFRSSSTGQDTLISFGPTGVGASIPAPGDYDGDGKTDVAVYIPSSGSFAIRPSSGTGNYLVPFGTSGQYKSVPTPGDYDGDGKTDIAVYLPTLGEFAYRPSTGGKDILQAFGTTGLGATVPVNSIPYSQPSSTSAATNAVTPSLAAQSSAYIPLTDDLLSLINGTTSTKKKTTTQVG